MWKRFHRILQFYRTKRVISPSMFKTHWWIYHGGEYIEMGRGQMLSDDLLSFWVHGGYWSAKLIDSKEAF